MIQKKENDYFSGVLNGKNNYWLKNSGGNEK